MILAGGRGTRLESLLGDLPKPMISVGGRPFLEYLVDQGRRAGIHDVLICAGYREDRIRHHFGDGREFGVSIRYSVERELLGTAGALRLARAIIGTDPFLVMNGDSFCPLGLADLQSFHQDRHAVATLAVSSVGDRSRFGWVDLDKHDRVVGFGEKDTARGSGYVNSGIYVLSQAVLDLIPENIPSSIEREVFPRLIGRGLCAYRSEQCFIDIGTPQSLKEAHCILPELVRHWEHCTTGREAQQEFPGDSQHRPLPSSDGQA